MSAASVLSNMEKQMQKWLESEVGRLAKVYKFSKKEAMDYLNGEIDRVTETTKMKKTKKDVEPQEAPSKTTAPVAKSKSQPKAKGKTEDLPQPDLPLPFCKVGVENQCIAVVLNHQLFTQCTHVVAGELQTNSGTYSLCKACLKSAKTRVANGNNALSYGTIEERLTNGGVYGNNGALRKPVCYANVMTKLAITIEQAQAAAEKMGWTIPEEELNPKPTQKGRPKRTKSVEVVADTSESEADGATKKTGRPKKNKQIIATAEGDDLIAALVEKAKESSSEDENTSNMVVNVEEASGTEEANGTEEASSSDEIDSVQKATDNLVKMQAAVMADLPKEQWKPITHKKFAPKGEENKQEREAKAAAKKQEKEAQAAAKKQEKEAQAAAKKQEKEAKAAAKKQEKEAKAATKKTTKEPSAPAVPDHDKEEQLVDEELHSEAVEEEEETQVIKWTCPEDQKQYLKAGDNVLYDMETQDPVGVWNDETQKIDDLPEEDEDEE